MEKEIKKLSDYRYTFIDKMEESWNEEKEDFDVIPVEIDQLGEEILSKLKEHRNELKFEFIFDELTKLGQAPSLIYDDNAHFAITSDGCQTISEDLEDTEIYHFVNKEAWKDTIREALDYYLDVSCV
jgi:hypothetical protein